MKNNNQDYGTCFCQSTAKALEMLNLHFNKRVEPFSVSWLYGNRNGFHNYQNYGKPDSMVIARLVRDGFLIIDKCIIAGYIGLANKHPYNVNDRAGEDNNSPYAKNLVSRLQNPTSD